MPHVFVTRRLPAAGLDVLSAAGVSYDIGQPDDEAGLPRAALLAGVRSADVLLCLLTEHIDREVLSANPRLLGVANMAVGFDNVDLVAATELGLPVSNTPGVLTDTTADLTWALLLAAARRLPEGEAYLRAGRYRLWGPNLLLGADVGPGGSGRRKVLGIVGFGRIGQAVARRAAGFDLEVLACDPAQPPCDDPLVQGRFVELDELLEASDFVTLHTTLTPATHHLIGAAELARMKPTALLVNTARGPIVDEAALVSALRVGRIAGAALDVYEHEPELTPGLAELDNVLLLPHLGSASHGTRGAMAAMAARNALCHLRGEPAEDPVNSEVYDTDAWRARQRR